MRSRSLLNVLLLQLSVAGANTISCGDAPPMGVGLGTIALLRNR